MDSPERIWAQPQTILSGEPLWEDGGEWHAAEPPADWGVRVEYILATVSDARVAAARAEWRERAALKMDELGAHYETEADRHEATNAELHDLAFFRAGAFRDAADDIRAMTDPAL